MKNKNEIISLNDKLFNEFSIEELEARLETDPLLLTTLFTGLISDGGEITPMCGCKKIPPCPGQCSPVSCGIFIPCGIDSCSEAQ